MSGFTGEDEWLLVFQTLSYGRPTGTFGEDVYAFGNKVPEPGFVGSREAIEPAAGGDFWSEDDEERFLPQLAGFTVRLGGAVREFSFSPSDVAAAGVAEEEMEPELAFIRTLAYHVGQDVLLKPEELLDFVGRPGLNLMFRLDGWRQPDSTEGEKPSDLPCFQAVADSIALRRPVALDVCATAANTHWSHWTEFE